jgi:acyl dehydratase
MIMNYAAAIDDPNPWHFADDRPEGIVAPPMMTWALTWPFSVGRKQYWKGHAMPPEVGPRGVHFTEEMEWVRPLRPGDKLSIVGEVIEYLAHRAGTYVRTRYVAVDAFGERVFTQNTGGMLRDVRCVDEIGEYKARGPGVDTSRGPERTVKIPIHPLAAHIYDGCADIHNPIHTSKAFAQSVGLSDIILHGTATLAFAVKNITNIEGGGDPNRVKGLYSSFTGMVFLGTEVELQVLGSRDADGQKELFFQVLNPDGGKAIRDGRVTLG